MSTARKKKTNRKTRTRKRNAQVEQYVVSDGELVLHLEPCEEGGFCVTCPFDPALITQAETLEEAFEMARDAAEALDEAREQLRQEAEAAIRSKSRAS